MKKIITYLLPLLLLALIAALIKKQHLTPAHNHSPMNEPSIISTPKKVAIKETSSNNSLKDDMKCAASNKILGAKPPQGTEYYCVDSNGAKDGTYMSWYGSGQIMQHLHYKKGKEHGKQQAWWPNGKMMMDGISMDGVRYQGFKYWDIFGRPSNIEFSDEQKPNLDESATPNTATN